jgi:hypothetical protein
MRQTGTIIECSFPADERDWTTMAIKISTGCLIILFCYGSLAFADCSDGSATLIRCTTEGLLGMDSVHPAV